MDPILELAAITVSYVWAWRELFPEHFTLAESSPISEVDVAARAKNDIAVYIRLNDLTVRDRDQTWISQTGGRPADAPFTVEALRQIQDASTPARGPQTKRSKLKRWFETWVWKGSSDDLLSVRKQIVSTYVSQLRKLVEIFDRLPVRGPVSQDIRDAKDDERVTRELLMRHVAVFMLEQNVLGRVAEALDYRPLLLRRDELVHDPAQSAALLDDPDYPEQLIERCGDEPLPFSLVLHRELNEIQASRAWRWSTKEDGYRPPYERRTLAIERALDQHLVGLCFSGGGIRSATFNLGVLQGMANHHWLGCLDYLSTVSGGGYIGAWLLAWIKRCGSVTSVEESLRGSLAHCETASAHDRFHNPDPSSEHVQPVRFLREYSNYLAPEAGFFSADSWTMVAIWMRNTLLNLLVLALFLMAALLAPRVAGLVFPPPSRWLSAFLAALLLWTAGLLAGNNLRSFNRRESQAEGVVPARGDSALVIVATVVVPLFIAAFFATCALWSVPEQLMPTAAVVDNPVPRWLFVWLYVGLMIACVRGVWNAPPDRDVPEIEQSDGERFRAATPSVLRMALTGGLACVIGSLVLFWLARELAPMLMVDTQRGVWLAITYGPLLILSVISLVIVLYLGFEGYAFPDERREWWSRVGAWIGLIGSGWAILACISFFAPLWVARMGLYAQTAGLGWAAITAAGAKLASSGKSNGRNLAFDKNLLANFVITVAPFAFIAGFLALLSIATHAVLWEIQMQLRGTTGWLASLHHGSYTVFPRTPFDLRGYTETYWAMLEPRSYSPVLLTLALVGVALLIAWRVDVNEFSMHHFYRNRLVRAYLGASRSRRRRAPNAFTGLDLNDDIKLWRFLTEDPPTTNDASTDCRAGFIGPFPIINSTLNVSGGGDLAWQQRQGQSFTFTPLFCGFDFASNQASNPEKLKSQFAYRPTKQYGYESRRIDAFKDRDAGLGIGTAVAISGAAANPNAGYHTSPSVSFLLTVFNARLGWWMGNPRSAAWGRSSPHQGLFYLLSELLGYADTRRKYVNLSDGGHFDNMGLYELVRRRCRYIVVCDAEQDEAYSFEGLAATIRKCRVDFGAVITLETSALRPNRRTRLSTSHSAIGTISYPGANECGTLVYIKTSLNGDESPDIIEYRTRCKGFPHQSTGDQFFDESQFESYRALGQHIADELFDRWPAETGDWKQQITAAFERLRQPAVAPPPVTTDGGLDA